MTVIKKVQYYYYRRYLSYMITVHRTVLLENTIIHVITL